jgi:hypothetical protein
MGSGTNMGKMVVNGVVVTGGGVNVSKMEEKVVFLQHEVVQMLKKWQKKVIFFNRKWCKCGKNGMK